MAFGIMLVIVGTVFLLQNLGYFSVEAWNILWPALLIGLGLAMIAKRTRSSQACCRRDDPRCSKEEEVISSDR